MTDSEFSKTIRERAGGMCEFCLKKSGSETHHVFSRRHQSIRHDPENGIFLCAECHRFVHERPIIGYEKIRWLFKRKFGQEWEKRLIEKRDRPLRVGEWKGKS